MAEDGDAYGLPDQDDEIVVDSSLNSRPSQPSSLSRTSSNTQSASSNNSSISSSTSNSPRSTAPKPTISIPLQTGIKDIDDSGTPLDPEDETIDYDLVYALHTFVANLEGQVCVLKGDALELLDDSNSYWWLVKCLKTDEVKVCF